MIDKSKSKEFLNLISKANKIVVVQADNPDADSLGSATALEEILGDMGKQVYLYCGVDMPNYLHYLKSWSRVTNELPNEFDLSLIVDASTNTLFQKLDESGQTGWLAAKPCIVLDHHDNVQNQINYAELIINADSYSSTGELIYHLARQLSIMPNLRALEAIAIAILGDTQGLSNSLASAETYKVMTELIENGVDRPVLEEQRREFSKMPESIFRYKAELIERCEFTENSRIACLAIPHQEIKEFSPLYNPSALVQNDMLQVEGTAAAIVFKTYDDGRITASIRCNVGHEIAGTLATHFGGGGHGYAAGFKITDGRSFESLKTACLQKATELLAEQGQA